MVKQYKTKEDLIEGIRKEMNKKEFIFGRRQIFIYKDPTFNKYFLTHHNG